MRLTLSASSYGIWRRYLRFLDTPLKRNPLFNNSVLTLLESLTDATLSSCPAYTTLHSWVTPEEWRSLLRKGKLDVFNTEMETTSSLIKLKSYHRTNSPTTDTTYQSMESLRTVPPLLKCVLCLTPQPEHPLASHSMTSY